MRITKANKIPALKVEKHTPYIPSYKDIELTTGQQELFWSFVNRTNSCWFWGGDTDKTGYGKFMGYMAHRIAYTFIKGKIPSGKALDHLCIQHACVKPDHLDPVSVAENSRRAATERWGIRRTEFRMLPHAGRECP